LAVLLAASLAAAPASARERPGDDTARAKTCFTKAEAHFSLGEFALALEEYRKAYLLRPLPPLLFNMAQCHRHLGELEKAVFLLRRFLASSPTAMQRAQAEAVLQDVELALKSRPAPATRPATAPAASAPLPLPAARPRAPTAAARPPVVLHAITPTAPASQPTPSRTPLYKRWWLWTIVAGVAAATATTIAVLASRGDDLPRGTLPPVDYR
jgi:tetratricopeptide (TPR) repeat protein